MNSSQTAPAIASLDQDFIQAIQGENPFDKSLFIKQQNIWDRDFVDVPSLNAEASDLILKAVEVIREGKRQSIGITLTAERGLGKSHVIGRICHRLRIGEGGFFIYMGEYSNLSNIKEEFLQEVAYSLKRAMRTGHMQWQELARVMFNRALQKNFSCRQLIDEWVPRRTQESQEQGVSILPVIQHSRKKFLELYTHIPNPYIVQAIFWTLSQPHASSAVNWLAGNEITPAQAQSMGLPTSATETPGFSAFRQAQQILDILSEIAPTVICFDELDSLAQDGDVASKPRAVVSLAKDILNNLKRGVVLTTMYPQTWASHIKTMPQAEGVVDRIGEKVVNLQYLNPQNVTALVTAWLEQFYFEKSYTPPNSIYPFSSEEMQIIGDERPTFRAALQDCREIFGEKINIKPQEHRIQGPYEEALQAVENDIEQLMEESYKIANALRLGFSAAIGKNVGDIEIRNIEEINVKPADQGYINFKVIAKEGGRIARIGVSVLQNTDGTGVKACLKRLVDYNTFDLTRGCLVRSKPISNKAAQAQQLVQELIVDKKGEWVWFLQEHITSLLAIYNVYERRDDYEITEAQIFDFIAHQNIVTENPLIAEILSKPSGKIPKDASYEDFITKLGDDGEVDNKIFEQGFGKTLAWIYEITTLADRSIEFDTGRKSSYQAGTDFEEIVRRGLEFIGFTVDDSHRGGAGGLDLYCSQPFPLVAECKAGKSIPNGAVSELIRLGGTHLGKAGFDSAAKLVIGAGKISDPLLKACDPWEVSIISAKALQRLVEVFALYPGTVNLDELRPYLTPGNADKQIDKFIDDRVLTKLKLYQRIIGSTKAAAEATQKQSVVFDPILQAFRAANPDCVDMSAKAFHELLIELSSPLVGYLGRTKGELWDHDRFYFLRELQTP